MKMLVFNQEKLEKRIITMYGSREAFGKSMGMSKRVINSRLKGATEFRYSEIDKAIELLNIQGNEINKLFFDVVYVA